MKTKEEIDKIYLQVCKDSGSKEIASEYCGFTKGYLQCQEDMVDKWFEYPKNIPPIHSENYLVFVDECIKIDLFRGDHNKFHSELYNKNCNITHWMPSPNKPLNKQD
jgi:hypothetical protein